MFYFIWLADEISDLNDRIIGLQQVKDAEKHMYERQLQQLRTEYKETKDQLIAENMVLGNYLFHNHLHPLTMYVCLRLWMV